MALPRSQIFTLLRRACNSATEWQSKQVRTSAVRLMSSEFTSEVLSSQHSAAQVAKNTLAALRLQQGDTVTT
jgi:hypothetical protein